MSGPRTLNSYARSPSVRCHAPVDGEPQLREVARPTTVIYEAELGNITIVATGDSLITRPISVYREEAFTGLIQLVREADVRFTNLETLLHRYEVPPAIKPSGFCMASHPDLLEELKWAGINLFSGAGIHTGRPPASGGRGERTLRHHQFGSTQ